MGLPSSVSFGKQRIGATATKRIRVDNHGPGDLTVTAATTSAPFSSSLGTCTDAIAEGGFCRLVVSFEPTTKTTVTGTLTVESNASNSPGSVGLTGSGR
jgi:hypothetical protein